MKTAATVFVSFLVFIGLACSFVAGGVFGYTIAKEFKPSVRPYFTGYNRYTGSAKKED